MVSFKRALKNAGKKIKKVFTTPFCSKKKKITEGGNKENSGQIMNESGNVPQTNYSVEIAQEQTQSSVVIETRSACEEISDESLSETPVKQATSIEAINEERIDGLVDDSEKRIDNSVDDSKETSDSSVEDTEITNECPTTNSQIPPLGVNATDVVGEEGVVLTCISNEEIEQMNNTVSAKYSTEKILDAINEDLVLQLITTLCYFSLNNKAKGINSKEIIHFEINLTNNSFCAYSASESSKPAEDVTEVCQQSNTTGQVEAEESITVEQNEEVEVTSDIPTENALIAEQTNPIKNNRRGRRNNPRRMTLTAPIDFNF